FGGDRAGRDGSLVEASSDAAEGRVDRDARGRGVREETRVAGGGVHWVKSGYGPDGHRVRVESSDGHKHHIARNLGGDVTRVELEGAWWKRGLRTRPARARAGPGDRK